MPFLTEERKISKCIHMKRVLQSRCRGLISLPTLNPKWTFDQNSKEIISSFCMGPLSIHRTVQDFIFADDRLDKLRAQINPALLDDKATLGIAFYFRLWHCDMAFQLQTLGCTSLEQYESRFGVPVFTGIFQSLLHELDISERPSSSSSLAPAWLPLIDSRLKQAFPSPSQYEAYLDDAVKIDYITFERFAEDPAVTQWHTDILCLAIKFQLFSYVREHLHSECTNKQGRPLLHYAVARGFDSPFEMLSLLLSKGCRLDTEFNLRTTWEFVLCAAFAFYEGISLDDWKLAPMIPLFLRHGADPNQQVDMHNYQCFALHVMFTTNHLDYRHLEVVLQDMLDRGADVDAKDSKGRSVIDLARENRPEAVSLLKRYSARSQPPPILDTKSAISKKITMTNGISDVSETLLQAIEGEERCDEFRDRRPLRIADGRRADPSNVRAYISNAALLMEQAIPKALNASRVTAAPVNLDEQDRNDEGFFEVDAPVPTAHSLTENLDDCGRSDLN